MKPGDIWMVESSYRFGRCLIMITEVCDCGLCAAFPDEAVIEGYVLDAEFPERIKGIIDGVIYAKSFYPPDEDVMVGRVI